MAGILGWLSKNEILIGEVLSRVSSSDGMLNADMFCDSIRTFQWFGGDQILWEVLVKDRTPVFSLYLQNSKNSQTSFATLQIINLSRSWSTSSAVSRSRYSIRQIREKQFYQSWCRSLYCVSRSPSSENTSSGSHNASEMG